jgi:hypothetical protein
MFVGFTGTFLKNGGQPLLYQYTLLEEQNVFRKADPAWTA